MKRSFYNMTFALVSLLASSLAHGAEGRGDTVQSDTQLDSLPVAAIVRLGTNRFRVGAAIDSLSISSDGRRSVCTDRRHGRIHVFDALTGKLCYAIQPTVEEGFFSRVVCIPGKDAFACVARRLIQIREIKDGRLLREVDGGPNVAICARRDLIAFASCKDAQLRLWDWTGGTEVLKIKMRVPDQTLLPGYSLAFSPDGNIIAATSWETPLTLWSTRDGHLIRVLRDQGDESHALAFSSGGERLAAADRDEVVLWDTNSGRRLSRLKPSVGSIRQLRFSPNGVLACCGADGATCLSGLEHGNKPREMRLDSRAINGLDFFHDGHRLLFAGNGGAIRVWNLDRAIEEEIGIPSPILGVLWMGQKKVVTAGPPLIQVWDISTRKTIASFKADSRYTSALSLSPSGKSFASAGSDGKVRIWDLGTRTEEMQLPHTKRPVLCVQYSPDGRLLASGGWDNVVRLWDASSGKELRRFGPHGSPVVAAAFSPDGRLLVSAESDARQDPERAIRLWDVESGQELVRRRLPEVATCIAFSPDGKNLAFCQGATVRVWGVPEAKEAKRFSPSQEMVHCVAFSPDGGLLVTGGDDNKVRVWSFATGKQISVLDGHSGPVRSLAFSPDGKAIVSGSEDTTVLIWNAP